MKILDILNVLNYYRINGILIDFVCMLFIIKKELCCLIFKHFVVLFSDTLLFDFQTVLLFFLGRALTPILTWMTAMGVIPTMKICLTS